MPQGHVRLRKEGMNSSPRVCVSEILISYSGNGMSSASDCRYPHAVQIPGTEAVGEGATFENNTVSFTLTLAWFCIVLHSAITYIFVQ